MTASSVAEVHSVLGYTEADAAALRKVRNIWKKLELLRAKAAKGDPQALRNYSEYLEKSLASARMVQALPDAHQAALDFWNWYLERCEALGVPRLELARGRAHLAWSEKWLAAETKAFYEGMDRFIDLPSQMHLDDAKVLAEKLLKAYVEAFTGH